MPRLPGRFGKPLFVAVLALVLTAVAAVGFDHRAGSTDAGYRPVASSADAVNVAVSRGDLASTIEALQARVRQVPRDGRSWAALGLAYVEQARVTANPSYYSKAEQALDRGSAAAPDDDLIRGARAALASARHNFSDALALADTALAKNPYSSSVLAIRADALTELGRYDEALETARRADEVRPSLSTFARLSYAKELRGDVPGAIALMQRAAEAASSPADAAFARYELGQLELGRGRLDAAASHYDRAIQVAPQQVFGLVGRARVLAAQGNSAAAVTAYEEVVARLPLPEYVIELGELYESLGRQDEAQAQYDVVRAGTALAVANGVNVDLETAVFEADHGNASAAVAAAEAEWRKRHAIHVADAMAWALHAAGRDAEAISYARAATKLGTKDARLLYHRGMIELALGRAADARRSLRSALDINPSFSPLHAPRARAALARVNRTGSDPR